MEAATKAKKTVTFATTRKEIKTILSSNLLDANVDGLLDKKLPYEIALKLTNYYYTNQKTAVVTPEHMAILKSFQAQANCKIDVLYTPSDADITAAQNGTPMDFTNLDILINAFRPQYLVIAQETQDHIDGTTYQTLVARIMQHVGTQCKYILDTPLVYSSNKKAIERGQACAKISGAQGGRYYVQIMPDRATFTDDQQANLAIIDNYFNSLFPTDLYSTTPVAGYSPTIYYGFVPRFPNLPEGESILQVHWEDASDQPKKITYLPNGNIATGRYTEVVLKNTDKINYGCWMSNGNLYNRDGTPNAQYNALRRTVQLYKFKYITEATFLWDGVTGLLCGNDDGTKALLVNNKTPNQYTINQKDLGNATGIMRDTGFAANLNDQVTNEIKQDLIVQPYSVSVITYTNPPAGVS